MEIIVNNTSIEVTSFDTEETILDKYALKIDDTLPEYFYVRTKDFRLKQGAKLKVSDIRTELENLNNEQFLQNLERIKKDYQNMSKLNITLLFLSKYTEKDLNNMLRGDAELLRQLMGIDTGLFSSGAVVDVVKKYKTNVVKDRRFLSKALDERMDINKVLMKAPKLDTRPFKPEGISIEIPVQLADDNTLPGIFDMIETSKKVPYVILFYQGRKWVKTYRHICPHDDWVNEVNVIHSDEIIFWVLHSNTSQSLDNKDVTKFYSMGTWNLENKIEISVDAKKIQKDTIKNNFLSSLGDRVEYR